MPRGFRRLRLSVLSMDPMSVDRYAVLYPARQIAAHVRHPLVTHMTHSAISLILVLSSVCSAQTNDTLTVKYSESKYDSTLYRRITRRNTDLSITR